MDGAILGPMSFSVDYLLLVVFACLAAPHTIKLGHNARLCTLQPFMLAAIVLFGVREGRLPLGRRHDLLLAGRPPPAAPPQGPLNIGNLLLSTWLGGLAYFGSGGRVGDVTSADSLLALVSRPSPSSPSTPAWCRSWWGSSTGSRRSGFWYEKYSWT